MVIVTAENAEQYPVPVGSIVKWARWVRWTDKATRIEWVAYKIRATAPIPEDYRGLELLDDKSAFVQIFPVENDGTEGVPQVFPFRTYRTSLPLMEFLV